MPNAPTICAASLSRVGEVSGRTGARLTECDLFGHHPAEGDPDEREQLAAGPGETLVVVGVPEHTERVAALDDREHLELANGLEIAVLPSAQVGDRRVTGLVRRDPKSFLGRCRSSDDGDRALRSSSPAADRARRARRRPAQRPHERLVEEMLDHHGRVTGCHGRRGRHGPGPCRGSERVPCGRGSSRRARAVRCAREDRSGSCDRTVPDAGGRDRDPQRGWWRRR